MLFEILLTKLGTKAANANTIWCYFLPTRPSDMVANIRQFYAWVYSCINLSFFIMYTLSWIFLGRQRKVCIINVWFLFFPHHWIHFIYQKLPPVKIVYMIAIVTCNISSYKQYPQGMMWVHHSAKCKKLGNGAENKEDEAKWSRRRGLTQKWRTKTKCKV